MRAVASATSPTAIQIACRSSNDLKRAQYRVGAAAGLGRFFISIQHRAPP